MKTHAPPSPMFQKGSDYFSLIRLSIFKFILKNLGDFFTAKNKLEVYTKIQIMNIFEVDEVQSLLTLKLKLTLTWIDVRHKYFDLDKNSDMNTLSVSEVEEIWTPDIGFINTKNSHRVNFKNDSSVVAIEIIKGIPFWKFKVFALIHEGKSFQTTVL